MSEYKIEDYEEKREMKVFQVELRCNECIGGHMKGNQADAYESEGKTVIRHICDSPNCSNIMEINKPYPHIIHELVK